MPLISPQGPRKRTLPEAPQKTLSSPQIHPKKKDKKANATFCTEKTGLQNTERQCGDKRKTDKVLSRKSALAVTLLVTLATIVGRVYYITLKTSWWVLHPDEIFQGVEVAYSEIYGYGFRAYEFLPPLQGDNLTQYQQWEQMHGMYALRSPLFPWFYVAISWLLDMFGECTASPYLVWRTGHVILASLLPLAVHVLTLTLSGSCEVGVMAATLVATSVHLTVLGTHTIIHSFLAPTFFLSLAGVQGMMIQADGSSGDYDEQAGSHSELSTNKHVKGDGFSGPVQAGQICEKLSDEQTSRETSPVRKDGKAETFPNANGKTPREVNLRMKYGKMDSLGAVSVQDSSFSVRMRTAGGLLMCGFCMAVSCYIRPDSIVFVSVFFVPFLSPRVFFHLVKKWYFVRILFCVIGAVMGMVVGVLGDFHFYGVGVLSPVNWFKFNILSNTTATFFGTESMALYCKEIFFQNSGMVLLFVINVVGMITSVMQTFKFLHQKDFKLSHKNDMILKMQLFICLLLLLGMYSMQEHKEVRFIHHVIALYFVFTALNIASVALTLSQVCVRIPPRVSALGIILLFTCSQWQNLPTATHESLKSWVYLGNTETYDITQCVRYIAAQKDVQGVFLNVNFNMMGGYTFLQHNVPLVTLTSTGYHEYDILARHTTNQKIGPCNTCNISLAVFVKISNYFDTENKPYLLHHLIVHKEYNYLLLATSTEFLKAGYREVFNTERFKVMKRVGSTEEEKRLKEVAPLLKSEPGGSVLKREASKLFAFGLKDMAAVRYERGRLLEGK